MVFADSGNFYCGMIFSNPNIHPEQDHDTHEYRIPPVWGVIVHIFTLLIISNTSKSPSTEITFFVTIIPQKSHLIVLLVL